MRVNDVNFLYFFIFSSFYPIPSIKKGIFSHSCEIIENIPLFEFFYHCLFFFFYDIPIHFPSQQTTPKSQLLKSPYKITGPAMVKILHPIPNTCPSALYSIAGAATELANPVMGTSAPAPPNFTSF